MASVTVGTAPDGNSTRIAEQEMELRQKVCSLIIVPLGSSAVGVALARNNSTTPSTGTTAPLSSAYIQYQQNLSAGTVVTKTRDGHSLGHVPPPIDLIKPVPTQAAPLLQAV